MKEKLIEFLRYAPRFAIPNPDLSGWRLQSGEFVCAHCAARLMARGCFPDGVDHPASPVWKDESSYEVCLLIEAH